MQQRIITAVIALAVLGVVLFVLPPLAVHVTLGLLIVAGAWEWSGFLGQKSLPIRMVFVAVIAGLLAVTVLFFGASAEQILIASLLWWFAALIWTFFFPTAIPEVVRWLAGILTLVPLYVALVSLYDVDRMLLLFALLVIWVADSGAYVAGRTFGRVKLAPQVSPGKTWEGVIGGLVAVVLLVLIRAFYVETDLAVLIPFCLAAAALSIVGDLTVSMFKRTAGVKDSGSLFPGHGGVLDRIDSVSAAAPLFALGLSWVGLS
ncbi:MAG: phosphatidate cytidylyltransferase [Woeseiaceae bacterium]